MNASRNADGWKAADEADALRIHRLLLGDLDPDEFRQLERDLLASPSLRQRFMRAIRIDMTLRDGDLDSGQSPPAGKESRWRRFSSVVSAIAALLILAAALVWSFAPMKAGEEEIMGTDVPSQRSAFILNAICRGHPVR